ncbi:alpha-mannosidase [Paenibacillus oleatilyticus]|uniref:Alpha-mannosidase n=1 Tax=Paenibacillus oleatilyticus TaxID=2594886 RepID=A0ABV4V2C1_9BACL
MRFVQEKLERRINELAHARYRDRFPLTGIRIVEQAASPQEAREQAGAPVSVGIRWGGRDQTVWFVGALTFPEAWKDRDVVGLIRLGNTGGGNCSGYEALAYLDGEPAQALDRNHGELFIPAEAVHKGSVELIIQAWSGLTPPDAGHQPFDHRIDELDLAWLDPATDDLYYTALHVLQAVRCLEDRSSEKHGMLTALDDVFQLLDWRAPGSKDFYAAVEQALALLKQRLEELPRGARPQVTAVGHCHIDVAWLWRLKHTREKSARSWSTVLQLMDRYPEYIFFQSQPQLYAYLKEDYPAIYEKLKQRVAENRWEASGAMWLESDCNIPSGESLVRQLLYGKRFFREEFGVDNRILWLPDVFGYSWALPQILKKAGIDYFMTTKISWSQYNRFPHDTFHWRGIDGTELLTHFITTPNNDGSWYYTYNGNVTASSVQGLWDNYRQKELNDQLLLAYGWGDGGGGPTRDMLEAVRRFEDMPAMPQVRQGRVEEFFEALDDRVSDHPRLPLWDGELYLEYHRGTYTSQAYNKRMNRRMEALLHQAEFVNSLAMLLNGEHAYPVETLRKSWIITLRNQFHDIIPGSSIGEVYEDSREEYAEAEQLAVAALEQGTRAIAGDRGQDGAVANEVVGYRVINPLGWERSALVEIPLVALPASAGQLAWSLPSGEALESQLVRGADGQPVSMLVHTPNVPALGYTTIVGKSTNSTPAASSDVGSIGDRLLETPFYRIELNGSGQIVSLYDKQNAREVLKPGEAANVLQVFEDKPMAHDAWDIDIYYQEKSWNVEELTEAVVEEQGPLRAVLKLVWRYHRSVIEQKMTLYRDHPRIDFCTRVDWREKQHLLKAAFPVDVRSTKATYEIQFGNVERPTHWNTSWDWARFESVAQRWVDLSEGGYGVSLLNDCKYGHDIRNHVLRLSLIKSAVSPDPEADQGLHEFTYSLYPHKNGWLEADTHRQACELNMPLLTVQLAGTTHTDGLPEQLGLFCVDGSHVMIDTVKKAEDDETFIVRLYEYGGIRGDVRFGVDARIGELVSVEETNLMEEHPQAVEHGMHEVRLFMKPYEIKTLRIALKA